MSTPLEDTHVSELAAELRAMQLELRSSQERVDRLLQRWSQPGVAAAIPMVHVVPPATGDAPSNPRAPTTINVDGYCCDDRVCIEWDRDWAWGRRKKHMKRTGREGKTATVTRATKGSVYALLDTEPRDSLGSLKQNHNVRLVAPAVGKESVSILDESTGTYTVIHRAQHNAA
jgi:hypothetical protein